MATSRRRSARANLPNTQDSIEEDPSQAAPSARRRDDEVATQPSSKKVKKEKSKKNADPANEPSAQFSPEDFMDQPLRPQDSQKLSGLVKDWDSAINVLRDNALKMTCSVAEALGDAAMHDEEAKGELVKLETSMCKLLDCKAELGANRKALEEMRNKLAVQTEIVGAVDEYEERVQKLKNEYKAKTARQKYANEDDYSKFKQNLWECDHPGEPMPPLASMIDREDGDESDDDDIQVGGVTQDFKCPLSLTYFVDPLTSKPCKHSFSAVHIREFLGTRRSVKKKCPASGCNMMICLDDLEPDADLAKKVRVHKRREEERQRDSEDDEVVE